MHRKAPSPQFAIKSLLPILVLILASFAVYGNALFGDFIYDDNQQITENPFIRDVNYIPKAFTENVWSFQLGHTSNYYRPLMHVSFLLSYYLFGLNPLGFHLVNILFHIGVTVLVFLIIQRLTTEQSPTTSIYLSPPFIAAMIFATHPIHTEAVAWISALPEVAFTFFYLLSFYVYVLSRNGGKTGYILSLLFFTMATLFKEQALTYLIILIAYELLFNKDDKTILSRIKTFIPFVIISCVYFIVRYSVLGSFAPQNHYSYLSTFQVFINVLVLFKNYLVMLIYPFGLTLWHTFHPIRFFISAQGIISAAVALIYTIVLIVAYRKNSALFFGLLLTVVALLPAFYITAIPGTPFSERYLYLPSVGYAIILAVGLMWIRNSFPTAAGTNVIIAFLILIGVFAVGTIGRNHVWQNELSIWQDTVQKSPDSAMAHLNLGAAYTSNGSFKEAIKEYHLALALDPYQSANLYLGLGVAYEGLNRFDEALAMYKTALNVEPSAKIHKA